MQMLYVMIKELSIRHTHKYQVLHPRGPGRINGGTALLKLHFRAFFSGAEVVSDDKHLLGTGIGKGAIQIFT